MAIVFDSDAGTISGLSVGGLPDGIVDGDTLANNAVVTGKIADGTIANADVNSSAAIAGSKISGSFGKVLQVINSIDTSSATSNSTTFVDTGLSASITPTATTSKILVIVNHDGTIQGGDTSINYQCFRDTTEIGGAFIGRKIGDSNNTDGGPAQFGFTVLDTPSSTSSLTYKTKFNNHNADNTVRMNAGYGSSTMCLMEIGA